MARHLQRAGHSGRDGAERPAGAGTGAGAHTGAAGAAIEIEGLRKTYPRKGGVVRAVDGVSLRIPSGQVLGLLGSNGAGKTTTIKMMLGLVTPDAGHVRLNGYDVQRQRAAAMCQVGAVLEGSRNVYWTLSAWQNLLYFGRLKGLSGAVLRARAERLLRSLGLWERRHEPVGGFSRGMQQKVAVAAALVADPPIVLLDEPTVGLDVEAARTVKEWVTQLAREEGKTVVLTTHQMHEAEELCDRIAVIRQGQVIADLPVHDLLARFRRREQYEITVGGRADELALPPGFSARIPTSATAEDGEVTPLTPVNTVITGPGADERALYLGIQLTIGQGQLPRDLLGPTAVGMTVIVFLLIASLALVADLMEELRTGTLEQMHLSPVPPVVLLLGWLLFVCNDRKAMRDGTLGQY